MNDLIDSPIHIDDLLGDLFKDLTELYSIADSLAFDIMFIQVVRKNFSKFKYLK